MKLILVPIGKRFRIGNYTYSHDFNGRSGSGKVAVFNLDTNEAEMLPAQTEVELVNIPPIEPEVEPSDNYKNIGKYSFEEEDFRYTNQGEYKDDSSERNESSNQEDESQGFDE